MQFPDFQPRTQFNFQSYPHWYIGHMSKGKVELQKHFKHTDVVLEVRDARAPFTTAQWQLTDMLSEHTKRLVVLNKCDLVTPNVAIKTKAVFDAMEIPVIPTSAVNLKNLIKIKEFAFDHIRPKYATVGLWMMVMGLPNVGKSTIINGLKRLAFTASKQQEGSKLIHGVKRTEAKTGKSPGVTTNVGFFQISNKPRLYCYDTPGIMLLKKADDPERNVKLAMLGIMPDHVAGEMYIADYCLYRLNKERNFTYVEELNLDGPSNSIREISGRITAAMTEAQKFYPDPTAGAAFFLKLFRLGHFGKICIDHVPSAGEVGGRLNDGLYQTEPPDPWTPQYPEFTYR